MLADSALMTGPSTIVADNVQSLPEEPDVNALVYLLEPQGDFERGLYIFISGAWMILSTGPVVE